MEEQPDINRDDKVFIKNMLAFHPYEQRRRIYGEYVNRWLIAMNNCSNFNTKQNEGRRAANTFLREITEYLVI